MKRIFEPVPRAVVEAFVRAAPTGIPVRRAWYLYEILTGRTLQVADAPQVAAVDLLDAKTYFTGKQRLSKRHRVRDDLLGTATFCPMFRRTKTLVEFVKLDLSAKAREPQGVPVYIHPFRDGNGRMHRCLIHHVLAERKFTPPDLVFPVSSVMLDRSGVSLCLRQAHGRAGSSARN